MIPEDEKLNDIFGEIKNIPIVLSSERRSRMFVKIQQKIKVEKRIRLWSVLSGVTVAVGLIVFGWTTFFKSPVNQPTNSSTNLPTTVNQPTNTITNLPTSPKINTQNGWYEYSGKQKDEIFVTSRQVMPTPYFPGKTAMDEEFLSATVSQGQHPALILSFKYMKVFEFVAGSDFSSGNSNQVNENGVQGTWFYGDGTNPNHRVFQFEQDNLKIAIDDYRGLPMQQVEDMSKTFDTIQTGIYHKADGYISIKAINQWSGLVNGEYMTVYAGARMTDPQQGSLVVVVDPNNAHEYPTPTKNGAVQIVKADTEPSLITLQAQDGSKFLFDVQKSKFIEFNEQSAIERAIQFRHYADFPTIPGTITGMISWANPGFSKTIPAELTTTVVPAKDSFIVTLTEKWKYNDYHSNTNATNSAQGQQTWLSHSWSYQVYATDLVTLPDTGDSFPHSN